MAEPELKPAVYGELAAPSGRRVLKVLAETDLIRRMDALILASRGGYADRSEFVTEALRDRIEAEEELRGMETAAPNSLPETAGKSAGEVRPETACARAAVPWHCGDWHGSDVPSFERTVPAQRTNFGLHNRDLPTLWAADFLGRMTAQTGAPVVWSEFIEQATAEAWAFGEVLAAADFARPSGLKRSAGFPLNRKKQDAAEVRFRDHAIGVLGRNPRGPFFVFGLGGLEPDAREPTVALTPTGLQLLAQLGEAGLGDGPPFGAAAWASFAEHLRLHAAEELGAWRAVLAVLTDKPNRRELVKRCDWWSGATADTNVMGYVARGREWGLVALGLDGGRYELTELGREEATRYGNEER
jgi:Arc/MetJ-type ribon-helix-helix transcriptional regulator